MFYSELKLLLQIKQNPKQFLDNQSLYELIPFIQGVFYQHQIISALSLRNFSSFVSDYYQLPREMGFERAIRAKTKTEEEAFDVFFDLLDVFISQNQQDRSESISQKEKNNNQESTIHLVDGNSLIDFLLKYEKRIAMVISENSFQRLICFIKGTQWNQQTCMAEQNSQYSDFTAFVKRKLGLSQNDRYDRGILAFASSDQDALNLFFDLLKDFFNQSEGRFPD